MFRHFVLTSAYSVQKFVHLFISLNETMIGFGQFDTVLVFLDQVELYHDWVLHNVGLVPHLSLA